MFESKSSSKNTFLNELTFRNILELFFIILLVVIALRIFVLDISQISSESMEPILSKNDIILVSKVSYYFGLPNYLPLINSFINFDLKFWYKEPKINDIVVFVEHDSINLKLIVKRIASIPNDTILFDINTQLIRLNNDYPFEYEIKLKIPKKDETIFIDNFNRNFYMYYIKKENKQISDNVTNYKFKYNYYFVMGDNLQNSRDSREFGLVSENSIIGNALLILISPSKNNFFKFIE